MNPLSVKSGQVRLQRLGLTLVELMVTVAITAVLIAVAVPSMQQMIAKRRVAGVVNELATDLRYLRSLGAQKAVRVQLDFGSNLTSACYVLSLNPQTEEPCDCTNSASCNGVGTAPMAVKTVTLPISDGLAVSSDVSLLQFYGPSAMPLGIAPGGVLIIATVSSSLGGTARVWINETGRAVSCSVSGQENNFPAG